MSTVKTNNVQVGQSVTATNNFTWYQPATPDGTVRLGNGNSGSVTDLVTLTSAGNLGIGTSSPGSKLTIAGSVSGSSAANGYDAYTATRASRSFCWGLDASGNYGIWDTTSGANNRLLIDSSGNLGLGVTPSAWRTDVSFKALQLPGGSFTAYMAGGVDQTPGIAANGYVDSGGTWRYINSRAASWYIQNGGMHAWYTAPSGTAGNAISFTQAMTLDASGNLLVGKTSASATSGEGASLSPTLTSVNSYISIVSAASTSASNIITAYSTGVPNYRFYVAWNGQIYATSTSITAISDISLKENIRPLETGLAEVLALQPRRFDWKNGDGNDVAGFIAQEVETVLPDLVSDYKYNDEETKRGLKMGDMIPTLVKAIQELSAELNLLKQKVNA